MLCVQLNLCNGTWDKWHYQTLYVAEICRTVCFYWTIVLFRFVHSIFGMSQAWKHADLKFTNKHDIRQYIAHGKHSELCEILEITAATSINWTHCNDDELGAERNEAHRHLRSLLKMVITRFDVIFKGKFVLYVQHIHTFRSASKLEWTIFNVYALRFRFIFYFSFLDVDSVWLFHRVSLAIRFLFSSV